MSGQDAGQCSGLCRLQADGVLVSQAACCHVSYNNYNSTETLTLTSKIQYHLNFRTSFKLAPSINGREIDLYLLYWLVTAQGGWERVRDVDFIDSSMLRLEDN